MIAGIAELQSIVTMEAMASGLPVLAVNAVALPELVHNGENGYLFDLDNENILAEHIGDIFSNPALRERMAKQSLEFIIRHDINKSISDFETLYRQVTS